MNYELEKKYHISFCGAYCHLCDWHTGKIRKTFQFALDTFDGLFLKRLIGKDIDIKKFRKALEKLANSSICPGCKPEAPVKTKKTDRCQIRQCCFSKGYDLCCECSSFPCKTLKSNKGVVTFGCLDNLKTIKVKGVKYWIDKQWQEYIKP